MARKIFMVSYDDKSRPNNEILSPNGLSFKTDKAFLLICNFPIKDRAYFEFTINNYYPIKIYKNIPIYVGIHKEPSFGTLNSDFMIGSLYYNAETLEYDIMSKYSKQYLNYHTHPDHIYYRRPGAQDVIGVGVDYATNTVKIFVNGKLFYNIENKTFDEDGNEIASFDLTSGTFYFCIWSNIYYKKILSDFNYNSDDEDIEKSKEINGVINFGSTYSPYVPDGYNTMYSLYANYVNPPDEEDLEEDPTDAFIFDPSLYEGMNNTVAYIGNNNSQVTVRNPIDIRVETMALTHYEDETRVTITDKYKYSMEAAEDPDERYFSSGSAVFINKPIPTEQKIYVEFYVTKGALKSNKIGIPISVGITNSIVPPNDLPLPSIIAKSSRIDLYHDQWYHYYWREMNNSGSYEPNYVQHNHEIDNIYTTITPEQGKVIGLAFNLAKNKVTVYVDNIKMYTMRTNRVVDRESGETFTISNTNNNYYVFTGNNGTIYREIYGKRFKDNHNVYYDYIYNSHSGRYELYEEGSRLEFIPDDETIIDEETGQQITVKSETSYHMGDMHYTVYTENEYTRYLIFEGDDGTVYTQVKSDVMVRNTDNIYFELRQYIDGESLKYNMVKTHSVKQLIFSDLDYSKSYEFTYAFIHDEGAFDGTVSGTFNFGQDPFAATMPDGYMSLWDYYALVSMIRSHNIQDISSKINIIRDKTKYAHMASLIKIVNTGRYIYGNNGINKMILNHNIITDEEPYYYTTKGLNMNDFISMISRENNGYIPEEKLNSVNITFEGIIHYTIYIPNLQHQHIEAYLNGKNKYLTTFQAPKGSFINVKLIADKGYTAGNLNLEKITVNEDTSISATPAVLTKYTVNIIPTINQHIEIVKIIGYNQSTKEYIVDENKKYDSRTTNKFITTIENPDWLIRVIPDYGYNAGKPNYEHIHVEQDITVSAENAKIKLFVVTIPNTVHQVISVRFNQIEYESNKVDSEITDIMPKTFEVPYNTTVYIESKEVDLGYKISGTFDTYKLIDRDTTITAPTIVDDMCTITVKDTGFRGTYNISNSIRNGKVFSIRRGDTVTITVEPSDGLYIDKFTLE